MTSDRVKGLLEQHAREIAEVCDSVQIVVTFENMDENGTSSMISTGVGSFHARWGAVREQVIRWDAFTDQQARDSRHEGP